MKNKQFKAYLRDQQRHHIKRSKRRPVVDESVPDSIVEETVYTSSNAASIHITIDEITLQRFAERMRAVSAAFENTFFGALKNFDLSPAKPKPWTDSIRYTLEDGKKVLSWKMPYFASAFITEIYYSHIHEQLLFRRGVVESPYVLHDQCTAVGLVLIDGSGAPIANMAGFPVTKLSEMEATP